MTGPQLKEQRTSRGIKAADLASKMGLGRTRVPQIEAQAQVSDEIAKRFIDAVIELAAEAKANAA